MAVIAVFFAGPAYAAPVERDFNAWRLWCDEICVVSQQLSGRGVKAKAEVTVLEGKNILRLVLPPEASSGEDVAFLTSATNAISVKPECNERECVVTHQLDPNWMAPTMKDPELLVMFNVTPDRLDQIQFKWPMLQEAIMAARSR